MSDPAVLNAWLRSRRAAAPVQLWTGPEPAGPAGPGRVAILASRSYLAIVPAGWPGDSAHAMELLAFARHFAGFPPYQRQWRWSAALEMQLDVQLEALAAGAEPDYCYLYLNGVFQKKAIPGPGPAPVRRATVPGRDPCRAATPMLDQVLRVFGTASLLGTTLDATPGHDSYHCYSAHDRVLGIGRGHSERQMMRGAVFEYCERWAGSMVPPGVVHASYDALTAAGGPVALRPDELAGVPEAGSAFLYPGFARARGVAWTGAVRHGAASAAQPCLVPLAMVNYLLPDPAPVGHALNSNGCALGNSPEEAALFGALEVIERDALLLAWYSKSTPPRLALTTAVATLRERAGRDPAAREAALATAELLHLLAGAGYETACFDIGTEWRVPTVLVVLLGKSAPQLGAFMTAASHPDPARALHAALAEAWSLLGSAERNFARHAARAAQSGASLDFLREENQALYYADWRQRHHFDFLAQAPATLALADFLASGDAPPPGPAAAWAQLVARAAQLGDALIVADNTPPALARLGLSSARVFIPGAIPLIFGDHPVCIPPGRLARAAAACSWIDGHADMAAPALHPLG